jgi:hypothetical protein
MALQRFQASGHLRHPQSGFVMLRASTCIMVFVVSVDDKCSCSTFDEIHSVLRPVMAKNCYQRISAVAVLSLRRRPVLRSVPVQRGCV